VSWSWEAVESTRWWEAVIEMPFVVGWVSPLGRKGESSMADESFRPRFGVLGGMR